MDGDRKAVNCRLNFCYLKPNLICIRILLVTIMLINQSSCQVIKEINRDYHGDIFIIAGDPVSCDPSLCSEGQRFALPVSGHPCKCQCDPSKQIFREDVQQCVRDLDDCPLVTFTRTYISETIPVVSLPTGGQLVHPGAHLNLENRHNTMNQSCRVESDHLMTSDGWISIDNKPVFALIVDGSRSFLQWIGTDHNRRQLEQKLVLIRFNCQLKSRHESIEVAPYRPCAAVRIGWVPGSSLGLLKVQGSGYHDGNSGPGGNQGKGTSGYLIIGLSIGVLGLTYVLSLMIYLRSKRMDNLKHHRTNNNSSYQRRQYQSSSNQHLNHHGSSSFYGGDSSSNQTGSSSLERGVDDNNHHSLTNQDATLTKPFTLSIDRGDYGETITSEFNQSIKSDSINNRNINCTDQISRDGLTFNSFDHRHLSSSSLSVPNSSSSNSLILINNLTSPSVSSSTPLLTFPSSSSSSPFSSVSSISSTSSSPTSPSSTPPQSLSSPKSTTTTTNSNNVNHHNQHTSSSLNSLQARVKEKSAQFNGQFFGQSNVQTVSNLSSSSSSSLPLQPFRRSTRLSRRDLAIAPKLLDPEALSSPSPTAIEFLSRLREVISSARGRMRAFRFKPTLLVIPEDDYFISEFESKYRSITSSMTIDSSMETPSSLEIEDQLSTHLNGAINSSSISQEASSLYQPHQQLYQHDNSYRFQQQQQTQQPLSLPVAITNGLPLQSSSWKTTVNQFAPKLLSFGSSRRASAKSKSKVTSGRKENAISDSELSNNRSHHQEDHQLSSSSSSSSLSSIYKKNSQSSMLITAWGDDKASKVSRREIVDRLAEEITTVNDNDDDTDKMNGNIEMTNNETNEPDSFNDLSDINENLFETNGNNSNCNNNRNKSYEDTFSSENLVNLSNEVEKKLAQRSIVPLPEVESHVNGQINNRDHNNSNRIKSKVDGTKSNSSCNHLHSNNSANSNHCKEDSKLSQLVADLKHFTRKRKQIKSAKSLPMVSDNNWMLQPVASTMSLRLPSSRSSLSSSSKHLLLGNRSMRSVNNSGNDNNNVKQNASNTSGKYSNNHQKNSKSANKQSRIDEKSQVITIQEGRYLNFNNNHSSSISDEETNSPGNEIISSRCPIETWSLSSQPNNNRSSSPNYNQTNNNNNSVKINNTRNNCDKNDVNINIEMIDGDENFGRSILDSMTHDEGEMFISFTGNEFDLNGSESGEVGYISRFNLIKKYIDDPNIFNIKDEGDDDVDNGCGHRADGHHLIEKERIGSLASTINENYNENNNILRNQLIINSLSDSSVSSSPSSPLSSQSSSSPSTNHYQPSSNVINSTTTMNQWKSINSKHFQPSPQSLPLLTSLSSIKSSSSSSANHHLYPLEVCSSDDGLSSASVSSIMFMESPKQGRRKSVDRLLTNQCISTERDNQINYGNNNNDINNSMMMVRGGGNRGNWNNKVNQPTNNNGIRLNRQSPVEKRHFPNGLMTIA